MGCCQGSNAEKSEIIYEKNSPDLSKSLNLLSNPKDLDQKMEATPSFGAGHKKFTFE